jgi:hypothetical protein
MMSFLWLDLRAVELRAEVRAEAWWLVVATMTQRLVFVEE